MENSVLTCLSSALAGKKKLTLSVHVNQHEFEIYKTEGKQNFDKNSLHWLISLSPIKHTVTIYKELIYTLMLKSLVSQICCTNLLYVAL